MFQLDPLPYDYNSLEPFIDEETMRIHHDKHHSAYIDNLNKALTNLPELHDQSIEALIAKVSTLPDECQTAVTNHGGGHLNHTFFWNILTPERNQKPEGQFGQALDRVFGSYDKFKELFEQAGISRFGSGWVWLVIDKTKDLNIISTPNQDSPISNGLIPVFGVDVWEHAYYLKYQNKRAEYLKNIWNVVNFRSVEEHFLKGLI